MKNPVNNLKLFVSNDVYNSYKKLSKEEKIITGNKLN